MSNGIELAKAYLQIIPSMEGSEAALRKELQPAAEKAGKEAGDTAGKKSGSGFLSGWKGVVTAAAAASAGIAFSKGLENAIGMADVQSQLKAKLNLTEADAQKAGDVAGSLYAGAYGESMDDVGVAVDAVMSSMSGMASASAADIESVTAAAMNLAAGFDVDVTEAATAAGIMMKDGLARNATEAMDLITAGMQNVPAGIRGEILPVMSEYSKSFAALGIDGETAMSMIVSASADGAIGMDKAGDALKEFTIRATDMSTSTSDVYDKLGLNMKDMTNDLLAGGDTANSAMSKIIKGLKGIEDPGEQAAASIALFGTPLEDLGVDQIPAFLSALDPASAAILDTAGAAEQFGEDLNSGPSVAIESMKRAVENGFGSLLNTALPAITAVSNFLADNEWVVTAFAAAISAMAVAWGIYTAVQWAANSAMLASPLTWIVLAIMAVVAAIVYIATQTTWFQDIWTAVWNTIKAVFSAVVDWIKSALNSLGTAWTTVWNSIKTVATTVWDAIKTAVSTAVTWVKDRVTSIINSIKNTWTSVWNSIKNVVTSVWSSIKSSVSTAVNNVKTTISNVMNGIKTVWSNGWNSVKDFLTRTWDNIVGVFSGGVSTIGAKFRAIGDAIMNPLKSAFNSIAGFWNSTVGKISFTAPDWVPGIGGKGWSMPKIPMLAEGGVVTGPTLSLIGEAGPEAVFPLDKLDQFMNIDSVNDGLTRADLEYLANMIVSGLSTMAEGAGMASDLLTNSRRRVRAGGY